MKIEVGKYYKTSDGRKAYVAFEIPNVKTGYCPFSGWVDNGCGNVVCYWMGDGSCGNYQLVSEWIEKPEWCRGNPAWARWQAHNPNGECYWFENKPNSDGYDWYCVGEEWEHGFIPEIIAPKLPTVCRWQDSLIEAPEGWGK